MTERESVVRTLGVAAGVALVCSLLVSAAVTWLRPIQLAYESIERNRAVLEAAGFIAAGSELAEREIVNRFLELETRIVDLDAGAFSAAVSTTYDYRAAINDPAQTELIPSQLDIANLRRRPRYLPAYVALRGPVIEQIVLPVYGQGMWSSIHGFISLRGDFATIAGIAIYEHGETPGIGDRVLNPTWLSRLQGRPVYDDSGQLIFGLTTGTDSATADVDAVTGATVTATAVENLLRYWLGENGYGPFLATLRREAQ